MSTLEHKVQRHWGRQGKMEPDGQAGPDHEGPCKLRQKFALAEFEDYPVVT